MSRQLTSRRALHESADDLLVEKTRSVDKTASLDLLRSLAGSQARIFTLRHTQNLPVGEIASRMSRTDDSVFSSLYRVERAALEAIHPASTAVAGESRNGVPSTENRRALRGALVGSVR